MCQSEPPDKAFSRAMALASPVAGGSELGGGVEGGVVGGIVFVGMVLGGGGVGIVSVVLVGSVEVGGVEDGELEPPLPQPKTSRTAAHNEKKTQVSVPARMRFVANTCDLPGNSLVGATT